MNSGIDKQKLRAGNFVENNGRVLRTINVLRYKYNKLSGMGNVLEEDGISEDEFLDSVNFLAMEGYIHLREISSKQEASIADVSYTRLEAKLTAKGVRLLAGGLEDNMVEV